MPQSPKLSLARAEKLAAIEGLHASSEIRALVKTLSGKKISSARRQDIILGYICNDAR